MTPQEILTYIAYIALGILAFSTIQFLASIHPPKFTTPGTPLNYGLEYKDVSFETSDGLTLSAWFLDHKKPATIIIGHGYPFDKANIFPIAQFLYTDYNLLYYDHRYFGGSEGVITTAGHKETNDVKGAIKFIISHYGKDHKIALYGFSMSASSMLMADTGLPVVADSPYADLENMVEVIYSMFGPLRYPFVLTSNLLSKLIFGAYLRDISPANAVVTTKSPILLIHGIDDDQIPIENAHEILSRNKNIQSLILKAGHGQIYAKHETEYRKAVKQFLKENL